MIFKNINSEDIPGLIICSEPSISSSAIRTKETTIDGRDGTIVEKLGYKTRIKNVEIGLKKDANVDKILSYFSGEGDLIFKNENDKVYKAAIYEQVDLERLLRLRKGSVAFYCQPFKYKRNDIFETIKDNKVKEKKGKHLELLNCAEQNVVDLKLEGSTTQATRSGKNLLNLLKCSFSGCTLNSDNKSLICNLNNQYFASIYSSGLNNWLLENKGKTITFSTGTPLNKNTSIVISGTRSNGSTYQEANENGTGKCSITIANDFTAITSIELRFNRQNTTFTDTTTVINYAMLEEGSTATEYEQYGVMPSPDYPSEIENIEGKNLFDGNKSEWGKYNVWQHNTGNYANAFVNVINIKGLNKCSISFKNNTRTFRFGYQFIDDNENYLSGVYWSASTNEKVFANISVPENASKIIISQLDGQKEDDIEIQLEEGTVATPYVPYNSLEIKNVGENLFDINNRLQGTINNDGDLKLTNNTNKFYEYDFKENTQYTLSAFVRNTNTTGNVRLRIWYTDKTNSKEVLLNRTTEYKYLTFTSLANKTIDYISVDYGFSGNMYIKNGELSIVEGTTATPYKPYQEQKIDFPLSEGQKLMEGSYLADDGIHHKRKQIVLNGTEEINYFAITQGSLFRFTNVITNPTNNIDYVPLSDHYIGLSERQIGTRANNNIYINHSQLLIDIIDNRFTSISDYKDWLSNNPITVEYELAEPEIIPYTAEQQEAYNQLQKLKLYKGQNTMFSLEGSIINLKYLEDTDEKVENQGNIYSKPIIRLEKTVFKEVEIAINGIRFKYNFEEDDYVEIDCEEMTVQYEGLDRNRRLVIDFEFPKLKEGNNDIVMYSGDCIIKCKRKDRWL